jgi:hypothetical protein
MLEIEVESKDFLLIDHGYVNDVGKHAKKLCIDYGEDPIVIEKQPAGMYLYFKRNGITECSIFYLHNNHFMDIHRRSHEETHVLHLSGNLDLLQNRLLDRGLDIQLMKCDDFFQCTTGARELVANIGSLYALELKNANIKGIDNARCPDYLKKALSIYQHALNLRDSSSQVS